MQAFDWRSRESYDYMDHLARRDWSWECVRRNIKLEADWASVESGFEASAQFGHLTVIEARDADTALDRWSLMFCDAPDMDARTAAVLWRPDHYKGVLSMTALPVGCDRDAGVFSLRDVRCSSILLLRPGDRQHVLFRHEGCGLQLAVQGASLLEPVRLMIDAAPDHRAARIQTRLLECFNELRAAGQLKPRSVLREIATRRLKTVFQILDGALAGASHREIALAVYGPGRVEVDWDDPREHLKDHIRKSIQRGRRLMHGRYRTFLC